jgi:hypothetical protein
LLTISWQMYSWTIYRNKEKWLITFDIKDSSNHDISFTIADKNVWATEVWNRWDNLTPRNCWNVFQWWNSYWFPSAINEDAEFDTSSTQVNTSEYWWTSDIYHNYSWKTYFWDTFITWNDDRSSTNNDYLWGNHTIWIHPENTINNIIEESNTKTFYLSSTSDLTTAQAAYDWYAAGKNPIVVYSNKAYTLYNNTSTNLTFAGCLDVWLSGDAHHIANKTLSFTISSDTVTAITAGYTPSSEYFLRTNYNYSTPYTPLYNGSPATKKYVDDSVSVVSGDTGTTYTIKVAHSDPSWVANNVITFVTPLLEYSKLIALNNADAILRELNTDALWYFQKFLDEWLIGEQLGPGDTSEETTIIYYYLMNSPEWDMRVVDGKGFIREDWAEVWNFIDYN